MSATPPEANTEYSRASRTSNPAFAGRSGDPRPGGRRENAGPLRPFILAIALLGAALLLVAEFTPLYSVHVAGRAASTSSEATGPHHSYALVPIALLAALLALGARRSASRPALLAIGLLGVLTLLIALLGDLPDAHARGVTHDFVLAGATPSAGLYIETLGAVALVLASGLAFAMLPAGRQEQRRAPGRTR